MKRELCEYEMCVCVLVVVVVVVVFFIYRGHKQIIQCFTMSQATIRLYRSPLDFHSVAAKAVSCWLRVHF